MEFFSGIMENLNLTPDESFIACLLEIMVQIWRGGGILFSTA